MSLHLYPSKLDLDTQEQLLFAIRDIIKEAPLLTPFMPNGYKFNIRITNAGPCGWISGYGGGYRYTDTHPETGKPWPTIPKIIDDLARSLAKESGYDGFTPQCCLINYYEGTGKLGLHQDRDEENLEAPIVSVSLGDACIFTFGGPDKDDPTKDFKLKSGDCLVFGGADRLAFHKVKKVFPKSNNLVPGGGRFNLTIRQVH